MPDSPTVRAPLDLLVPETFVLQHDHHVPAPVSFTDAGAASWAMPPFLTVAETAALLRTTPKAIYAMLERNRLPGVVRVGRRVLVKSATLLHWLDGKSTPSRGEKR